MPYQLTSLTIRAVAAVDDPDNPLAKILLFKRRKDKPPGREPVTKSAVVAKVAAKVAELQKTYPDTLECVLEAEVWEANPKLLNEYNSREY